MTNLEADKDISHNNLLSVTISRYVAQQQWLVKLWYSLQHPYSLHLINVSQQ